MIKTLVVKFDISKLDNPAFERLLTAAMDAPIKADVRCLSKFNVYEHSLEEVSLQLDPLWNPPSDGSPSTLSSTTVSSSPAPSAGIRCLCPMCEHHRTAEQVQRNLTKP